MSLEQRLHETDIDDIVNRAFLEGANEQVLETRFEPVSNRGIKAALLPVNCRMRQNASLAPLQDVFLLEAFSI